MMMFCWCSGVEHGMRKSLGSSSRTSTCFSLSYTAFALNPLNGKWYDGCPFASREKNSHSESTSAARLQPTDEQRFFPDWDVTSSAVTTRVVSTWLFRLNGVYSPF